MTKTSVNYSESNRDLRRKMKHSVFVSGPGIFYFSRCRSISQTWRRADGRTDGLMLIDRFTSEWFVGLLLVRCVTLGCELALDGYASRE